MVIMVHMASVWVPFTSESKEAVAHYPEITKEIQLAAQECGRKLAAHIRKRQHADYQAQRRGVVGHGHRARRSPGHTRPQGPDGDRRIVRGDRQGPAALNDKIPGADICDPLIHPAGKITFYPYKPGRFYDILIAVFPEYGTEYKGILEGSSAD